MSAAEPAGTRLVALGASAGGSEGLRQVIGALPHDLDAAVAVVMHLHPGASDFLVSLLRSATPWPVAEAVDGSPLRRGEVVVACADHHLQVGSGIRARVTTGPRENGFRPAVDTLFRSAARVLGPRAVGVVLSGMLDDGAFGLRTIRNAGGVGLVQHPATAVYADMPRAAIDAGGASGVHPLEELPEAITRAVDGTDHHRAPEDARPVPTDDIAPRSSDEIDGALVPVVCPSCGGNLWEQEVEGGDGPLPVQYRCRTGHRFSAESLLEVQGGELDDALWGAYRALLERAETTRRLAHRFADQGLDRSHQRWRDIADEADQRAAVLRRLLDQR